MPNDDQPNNRGHIDRGAEPIRFPREVVGGCDPFANSLGISIDDVSDSYARVSLWNVNLTNQNGEKIAVAQGMAHHFTR